MVSPRVRDERGLTLVEMMITLTIGVIIILATLSLLDGATKRSDEVQRRSGATQQGRAALDDVVRSLRSQVCVRTSDTTILSPVSVAGGSTVTYYADYGDATGVADKHVLTLTGGKLTDAIYKGSGTVSATTFPANATQTRILGTNLVPSGTTPVFQYFAFNTASPPTPDLALNSIASPTVAAADVGRIARILITVQANPEGVANAKLSTTLSDQVFVRLADPDDPAPSPRCA